MSDRVNDKKSNFFRFAMPKAEGNEISLPTKKKIYPKLYNLNDNNAFGSTVIEIDRDLHTKTPNNPREVVQNVRDYFNTGVTKPVEYRKKQLQAFYKMLDENSGAIEAALWKDLNKNTMEVAVTELDFLKNDLRSIIPNVSKWAKPRSVPKPFMNILEKAYVQYEPYGVVLVIGAWNYPVQLTFAPLIGAIAAGNCAIIKPSEVAKESEKIITQLIPKYLDNKAYQVYSGGVSETSELLKERFDYIFFTGSTKVGRIIQEAAAKHLTPVTLELGGKSPAFVDNTVNMDITASRLLWGKILNAGQTCVAPDYILCTKDAKERLLQALIDTIRKWFGNDTQKSPDFGRIVTKSHCERLSKLISDKSKIAFGGNYNVEERFFEPTILVDVAATDPVMEEEIFGPILPIVNVRDVHDAVNYINSHEKPLALYIFTKDRKTKETILKNTSSGGVAVNDTIMHMTIDSLPFGGVGYSGMGAYHGEASFETFSHKKSILEKGFNPILEKLAEPKYPPYNKTKRNYIAFISKYRGHISFNTFVWCVFFIVFYFLGVITTLALTRSLLK